MIRLFGINKLVQITLFVFFFILVFADFIANEKPIYGQKAGNHYFPIFHEYLVDLKLAKSYDFARNQSWKNIEFDRSINCPIPFSPSTFYISDKIYQQPGSRVKINSSKVHFLGTDQVGRDVAAGMIHGTRIAFFVGAGTTLIVFILGAFIGLIAGYFGDYAIKVNGFVLIIASIFSIYLGFLSYHSFYMRKWIFVLLGLLGVFLVFIFAKILNDKLYFTKGLLGKKIAIPFDIIISRGIEILRAIPGLIILLALLSIVEKPNLWHIVIILGLLRWPGVARLFRAEALALREKEFIVASKNLAIGDFAILWRHILPNAVSPVVIALAFGFSSAVVLEATLSFLGIGVDPQTVTWGSILGAARGNFSAWWLAVFPGIAIAGLVLIANYIGEKINEKINPRSYANYTNN